LGAWANFVAGVLGKNKYLKTIRKADFKNVKVVSEIPYAIEVSKGLFGKIKRLCRGVQIAKPSQRIANFFKGKKFLIVFYAE
jgi:hypothetical protein